MDLGMQVLLHIVFSHWINTVLMSVMRESQSVFCKI